HHCVELQQALAHANLLPSRISTTRSAASATTFEWVTTTTVAPCSDRRRSSASSTDCSFPASSSPVGSSAKSSFASRAAAVARAVLGQLVLIEPGERRAVRPDLARRRLVERRGKREERALAASGRTEDRHELADVDLEAHPAQGDRLHGPRVEDLEDVVKLEGGPFDPPSLRRVLGLA